MYAFTHGKSEKRIRLSCTSRRDFINLSSRFITCAVRRGLTRAYTSFARQYTYERKRASRERTWVHKPDGHPR